MRFKFRRLRSASAKVNFLRWSRVNFGSSPAFGVNIVSQSFITQALPFSSLETTTRRQNGKFVEVGLENVEQIQVVHYKSYIHLPSVKILRLRMDI